MHISPNTNWITYPLSDFLFFNDQILRIRPERIDDNIKTINILESKFDF